MKFEYTGSKKLGMIFLVIVGLALIVSAAKGLTYAVNSESVGACLELKGEVLERGFRCELPTGEIVNPVKYLESK